MADSNVFSFNVLLQGKKCGFTTHCGNLRKRKRGRERESDIRARFGK